ncbi:hypothetical protein IQ260_30015 [Leptolyngbya cf. ectocarpi LEGE 11479]|uniref:Uncharacterized protein n=1 Tax=Leptolyngbya cf. ectocarpi LEGE 11479 TaxID=1828722 RepID=A0A929A0N7_LEPEC|nr:hypothetical protein [Leptolyngbya ectocarpi]MBE9070876.1 hypothetical protein [Leptolyngbya cf. ectocarpi LEGE 11479]
MIISRRKLHLFSSIALAVLLPIIFIAGLLFRPTYATVTPDTEKLLSQDAASGLTVQPQQQNSSELNPIAAFLQQ